MFLMENSVLLQHFSYRLASCVPKYEFGLKCFCWSTRYCCNVWVVAEHPAYPSMNLVSNVFVGALGTAATFQLSLSILCTQAWLWSQMFLLEHSVSLQRFSYRWAARQNIIRFRAFRFSGISCLFRFANSWGENLPQWSEKVSHQNILKTKQNHSTVPRARERKNARTSKPSSAEQQSEGGARMRKSQ